MAPTPREGGASSVPTTPEREPEAVTDAVLAQAHWFGVARVVSLHAECSNLGGEHAILAVEELVGGESLRAVRYGRRGTDVLEPGDRLAVAVAPDTEYAPLCEQPDLPVEGKAIALQPVDSPQGGLEVARRWAKRAVEGPFSKSPHASVERLPTNTWLATSVGVVASPDVARRATSSAGFVWQRRRSARRLIVDPDVVLLRTERTALYCTRLELPRVWQFYATKSHEELGDLSFATMSDISMSSPATIDGSAAGREMLAGPQELLLIGADAGVELSSAQGDWLIDCHSCDASSIISALVALGVSAKRSHGPTQGASP